MRAILVEPGEGARLVIGAAPRPEPGPREIRVRARAAGINAADLLQRRGQYPPPPGASPILGLEVAGEVDALGSEVTRWKIGDRVMALLAGGGHAELVCVPEGQAIPLGAFSFEEGAAAPEAFLTAFLELRVLGELREKEWVIIHAAGSGVGTAALQVAREIGARSVATARKPAKLALARELGAEAAIDASGGEWADAALAATGGRGADVILDLIGASYWEQNLRALAMDGRLLLVGTLGGVKAELDVRAMLRKRARVIASTLRNRSLADKAELVARFRAFADARWKPGRFWPRVDRVLPWEKAEEAHALLESGSVSGKVVLKIG